MNTPKDSTAERTPGSLHTACCAAPDELEKACRVLLVGDFWCDTSHLKARIYSILSERGLMTINEHGQMVEVRHNSALTEGGKVSVDCNSKPNPPFGAANG